MSEKFQALLHELRVFLSVVLGLSVMPHTSKRGWIYDLDDKLLPIDCKFGYVGYEEVSKPPEFPSPGEAPSIERREAIRPGLGPTGIWPDMHQQWVPTDIEDLWRTFTALSSAKKEHFLRAGNSYVTARSMWLGQRTAYAVFLVVACESLKLSGRRYEKANIYDVAASLLGSDEGERLRKLAVSPQRVRNEHVHRGKLVADELLPMILYNPFADPSFDEMIGELTRITRTCLIEWLRRSGEYKFIWMPRAKHSLMVRIRDTLLGFCGRIAGK